MKWYIWKIYLCCLRFLIFLFKDIKGYLSSMFFDLDDCKVIVFLLMFMVIKFVLFFDILFIVVLVKSLGGFE